MYVPLGEGSNNLLDLFFTGIVEEWTVICWIGGLIVLVIVDWIAREGTMLRFQRGDMGVPCKLFHYVFWHGEVDIFLFIVPFKVDTAVEVNHSVLDNFVCLFLEGIIEVL
jgi:hypothetical protein